MLIYNCHGNDGDGGNTCSNSFIEEKKAKKAKNVKKAKKAKTMKKGYKSAAKRKPRCYSRKSARARGIRRSKVLRKKKILKKNIQFLEGIGLKVKKSC